VAALCRDEKRIESLLEKSLEKFSDELFIRHCPITQQEATTQVLLLSSGHIYRKSPMHLITLAKSSKFMNGISNRLNSKSLRARWLGMIVGMTISKLVDKPDNQMHFSDDVLDTPEAKWYKYLPYVDDKISKIDDMQLLFGIQNSDEADPSSSLALLPTAASDAKPSRSTKGRYSGSTRPTGTIVQLVEETDDLIPYAKPDSDPEDDDEDPTLVTRNKPRPPVYIRDLLSGLQEREKYDKHHLALSTAATLIRQKSGFGKEVTDHLDDLTSTLINLNDTFGIPNFLELRQEALIAVLLAQPAEVARYLARIVFEGDFSLQQRTTILVAIGFGARELAGFKDEERAEIPSFPSKQLPDDLAKLYLEAPSSLMSVSARLERTIVEPLAMRVADEASGPNALKVRTFSSRIAVEKARKKPIANKLAKVVADNFFFPLTGPWRAHMYAFGSKGSSSFSGHLLPTYLRTLALLLHASGPNTVSLPQMTAEFWDVLLSVRTSALNDTDYGVLEALLFALLILLEVNENKEMLAREHAKELMETQEWARLVLERIGPQGQEAERVRGLVASVVVRCHEVVERWQRLMVGDLVEF
jgi:telomere length regulation protein